MCACGWYGRYVTSFFYHSFLCVFDVGSSLGWSYRLADIIYAGCIPVLIGEATHHPFHDILDWSQFSVRLNPTDDLARLEQLLLTRYTMQDVERLQANVLMVRDAFVYPLDGVSEEGVREMMLGRRGPLWFAVWATRMREVTEWPVDEGVLDRP